MLSQDGESKVLSHKEFSYLTRNSRAESSSPADHVTCTLHLCTSFGTDTLLSAHLFALINAHLRVAYDEENLFLQQLRTKFCPHELSRTICSKSQTRAERTNLHPPSLSEHISPFLQRVQESLDLLTAFFPCWRPSVIPIFFSFMLNV